MIIAEKLYVEALFDSHTWTISYLVMDLESKQCALIDSVLDYDPKSGQTRTEAADRMIGRVLGLQGSVQWILETHVHADHLSAAPYLKQKLGGQVVIGSHITVVQETFGTLFNAPADFARNGSQFDVLVEDDASFAIGGLQVKAMHTPGHTPACTSYLIQVGEKMVAFVGDTLFMPDYGTARCDFPGADARTLYRSIRKLLALPQQTILFMCHDYLPNGRDLKYMTTVAEQRASNIHVHDGVDEDAFVSMRETRDATLEMPVLMLPAVQVNMRGGHFPEPDDNGVVYLKIPLNAF
ncbi:MBL fold metallo-hydrolase [Pseudomonas syringae]|uniref:Glyoxylase or a related metal-dependent hydrolase n=1 Tax=Pseudomonas syringae pv. actinidiae TaxID=103796 RepID=A0A2V0Q378_PSESF|nr:MBL fold metallo-hydrolase [Pseudomonas syringae]EPN23128.1 metallo-beta-lactamase superfamily protein [Pseudomonas syringae pv. actinidiae ICMP 19070]AQL35113.1 MBL fold metallo-hydrolase [Pseudomonas syringae pv. actinidiae ICMP 9853]EGH64542.1 metallo-beta-lactamase superfamily protein [Pseudomonas syringae pv. actinidiae str. M302091]EPM47368.1 metallo-beta-lactamase superfamily protein [Pseudomonas syringae pv. actinidiae ICMP 19103]EPM49587.1 metallo-beta-lactamase superfamily protein